MGAKVAVEFGFVKFPFDGVVVVSVDGMCFVYASHMLVHCECGSV